MPSSQLPAVSRCSIILVHGTWGRGFFPRISDLKRRYLFRGSKRWFDDDSPFQERLKSLGWPIRAFLWSGANSVHARDSAARKLADQLRKDLADPDATSVIIAHSHGGNVALRALQHLDSMAERIRIVTLATPFLRVFANESPRLPWSVIFLMWWMISAIFMLVTVPLPFGYDWNPLWFEVFLPSVASIFVVWWLIATFINPHAARVIAENAYYDSKGAAASRMLVIRGVDDEAALSLAAGSLGSRMTYFVLTWLIPAYFPIALIIWILVHSDALLIFPLSAVLFFFLPGVFKSAFGREFLIKALVCDIVADSVPDTAEWVTAITLPPVKAPSWLQALQKFSLLQLRHGIYNHPQCVDEIMRWLRRVT
jgi:hypothetical protein